MDGEAKDLFKKAAELAAVVPEVMQPAAFNRALDLLMSEDGPSRKARSRRRGKTRPRRPATAPGTQRTLEPKRRRAATSRRAGGGGRPGPKAMLDELIADGFFATGKTGAEIIGHQKEHRGHTYKAEELSPALVRLLRDRILERAKNKDGIYEYTAR